MAEETPKVSPAETRKSGGSTFLMISAFVFVLLIMFNNDLRLATGRFVGYAFNPVASLWGFTPMWTILFAGLGMIVGTTAIRHYLVDWVHQAKVQETMRNFQKEFSAARKSNNTYQIKRLTDMQPEIMKLQADMSSDQLRPMAFTMLLVIPIFAWLSTLTGAGVVYAHDLSADATPVLLVAVAPDVQQAFIVTANGPHLALGRSAEIYAFTLPGATAPPHGTLTIEQPITHKRTTLDLSKAVDPHWEKLKIGELKAGAYSIRPEGSNATTYGDHNTRSHVILTTSKSGANASVIFVNGGGFDGRLENQWTLGEDSIAYAMVPFESGYAPTGDIVDNVRVYGTEPTGAHPVPLAAYWDVKASNVVVADAGASLARVVPHTAKLPWNAESDLNGSWWILPHWILLYSLISIPFGQVTQKALKLIEYRKVDLDEDGAAPVIQAGPFR